MCHVDWPKRRLRNPTAPHDAYLSIWVVVIEIPSMDYWQAGYYFYYFCSFLSSPASAETEDFENVPIHGNIISGMSRAALMPGAPCQKGRAKA